MNKTEFEKLARGAQRVAVAKEALALIHEEKIRAERGTYLCKHAKFCSACALGTLVVAKHKILGDDLHPANPWGYSRVECVAYLRPTFSEKKLKNIEHAFETYYPTWNALDNAEDCMIAILQNLIDGQGAFDRSAEYEVA